MNPCRLIVWSWIFAGAAVSLAWAAERPGSAGREGPRRPLPVAELQPDPRVPTLESTVGHRWGQEISSYAEIERYAQALAKAAPDRVVLVPYGKSYEGRTLYYLLISSPENVARREQIRAVNLQLADPRATPPEKAALLTARMPALVWLACCIHGNETSSPEAALLAAYHMAADRRPETRKLLQNVLFFVDPLQNPDGHERFVNVYRETRGVLPDADPLASEHTERWPGGRFNHYLFDMNRDWFLQSQRETQGKTAAYLCWHPHIYADAHEMGSDATYYFVPPRDPLNPFILPSQIEWLYRLGRQLAGQFDQRGIAYTTREIFDGFYPGKGSDWPLLLGSLGLLWEQAGVRGLVIDRSDETALHFHDAVYHHYLSVLATLEFAAESRQRLVQAFYEARARTVQSGADGPLRHYFLPSDARSERAGSLAAILKQNDVEIRRLTKPLRTACADVREAATAQRRTIPAGSFHIPLAQPSGRLVRAVLDRHVDMGKEFVQRQLRRRSQRLSHEIYDVTAWSLPLAFDVECLAAESAEAASAPWDGSFSRGKIVGGKAKVAYLVPGSDNAVRALAAWLREGLRVHVADRRFRLADAEFARGTLILKNRENPENLHARLEESAKRFHLRVHAADTGFVSEGAHFGGPYVRWVRPPKVAMLVDHPTSYAAGHTWYLFDQVWGYPVTRVAARNLDRFDLHKYNVLVLPDGDYGAPGGPGEKALGRLKVWLSDGGTLILLKGATAWAADKKIALLSSQVRKRPPAAPAPKDATASQPAAAQPAAAPVAEASAEPPDPVPGAFLRARLFEEHWVTFGSNDRLDVFFRGNLILSPPPPARGRSLATFAAKDEVLSSGFCWPETIQTIAETPYLIYQPLGKGHLVAFTDDPNFRAMYPALQRLFVNAVMFSPGH